MLELRNLEIRYGAVPAVRNLSLEVGKGEIVGLIGANGAGKSTTLHAIMSLVPIYSGDIVLDGRSIRGRAPEAVARTGIALVPEGRRIYPQLTVDENLRLGLAGRRAPEGVEGDLVWVRELFPVVVEMRDRPAGTLSGGQLQMVCIGRGLMSSPKMIMLDEPSAALAPQIVMDIFRTIHRITRDGMTVLMVEQNVRMALLLATYGYVIKDGVIHIEGPAEKMIHDDNVRLSYLGGTVANREAQL